MNDQDIFELFDRKLAIHRHSKEFLAILEQASINTAIRAITHAKPILVFWVTPDAKILDAGNAHFDNPPQGDKSVLSHATNKGHLRGRAAYFGDVLYVVVYGDKEHNALSVKQMQLLKIAYSRIMSALMNKGISRDAALAAQFIQENGRDILF